VRIAKDLPRYIRFLLAALSAFSAWTQTPKAPGFETDILPFLKSNCSKCHGDKIQTIALNLASGEGVLKGSERGPVVTPGDPDNSPLYKVLHEGRMPPGRKESIPAAQLAVIRDWIAKGAPIRNQTADHGEAFQTSIQPFLKSTCGGCHGEKIHQHELTLTTPEGILKGGESGPVVVPGKPEDSLLYKMVHEGRMPQGGPRLADAKVAMIRDWIAAGASMPDAGAFVAKRVSQHDVIPILYLRCAVCHGLRRHEGGLDLRTKASILRGGKSGPAIVPGKPRESLLMRQVESGAMPPVKQMLDVSVRPITKEEIDLIGNWIGQGAPEDATPPDVANGKPDTLVSDKDRQFWAFQPPRRPAAPAVKHSASVSNPIDAFVLQKLEAKGLSLSPEADRATLIRRAYFDLTGLPPGRKEVAGFIADRDPKAYDKLIDRLLASPHYGERWGRYWLDAAGYADSEGKLNRDPIRPGAFRYRDYVIRSLNADKPYDRFLMEQIAGDELADYEHAQVVTQEMVDNIIATGFLRMSADCTQQRDMDFAEDRQDVIADEIDIFTSTVMGLTMKCARCHSHKYDPIPQRDYYRMVAIFKGAYDDYDWLPPDLDKEALNSTKRHVGRFLPFVTPRLTPVQALAEQRDNDQRKDELALDIKNAQKELKEKEEEFRKKILDAVLKEAPEDVRRDLNAALETAAAKRTGAQKDLVKTYSKFVELDGKTLRRANPEFRKTAEEIEKRIKLFESEYPPEPIIRALWDRGNPSPTYLLRRGSSSSFGQLVGPGVPSVLTDGKTPFGAAPPWPGAQKTGRRLALAKWLTSPDHPLTARVMVNRMWAHHFGRGIVKSVDNFGLSGTPPSQPELLDWLATEFVRNGWSMKTIHRLIMTSSVYRQNSKIVPDVERQDLENVLLSRMPMRRLDAEALYDTILSVSGRLDETPFGFPSPVYVLDSGSVTPIPTEKGWRRSIYTLQRRKDTPTALASFDFPQMDPHCLQRSQSTVATQALYLLNDPMVRELAASFAKRVEREAGEDPAAQIEAMYWIAVGRAPTAEEKRASLNGLLKLSEMKAGNATAEICHLLFNTAAFLYID
jgi:mono/diheme cytochrome c family protein